MKGPLSYSYWPYPCCGDTHARLAAGFVIGIATLSVSETIDLISKLAPPWN